ncbi:molybdenum cofactor guanylyltransferase [Yinghuangia sp. ASG 101]|uniref:NTP transferase domain-containing protein n=1 Tax=Yinghuangia sp. ASG 101 TaxID=2896848 RepID=UPI001E656209|nr:NTP transferase domain-containing protein [Yinghuangia sp. ASG 101]UGQ15235.1 molybdenum cofactor guanylyltransferase [Yinghuangia sp. ASG 101]
MTAGRPASGPYDAVVLAGGAARRLGGRDKPALTVGGRTLLDRAVDACEGARTVVVVGPERATRRTVAWAREDPPGGGPVAALAAGLPAVDAPAVVVLAADLPFVTREVAELLVAALDEPDADGAVLVDGEGRDQPLLAAYRTTALRSALDAVGDPHGAALRRLVAPLALTRVTDPELAAFDCDTWARLREARARSGRMEDVLEDWIEAVKAELGVELDVDTAALLDMTKVAAHNVVRPAAPLTAFLVGYAAARAGGGEAAVADALRKAEALAAAYRRPDPDPER